MESIEQLASQIAELANECCYRSDGYEKRVEEFALSALQKVAGQSRPIPVTERLPEINPNREFRSDDVLAYDSGLRRWVTACVFTHPEDQSQRHWDSTDCVDTLRITHWCELPPDPK